jgi:hypothetical protein
MCGTEVGSYPQPPAAERQPPAVLAQANEKLDQPGRVTGTNDVIGDPLRRGQPLPARLGPLKSLVAGCCTGKFRDAFIRRAIVDTDHLEIAMALCEQGVQTAGKVAAGVIDRNDHAH